MPCPPEVAAQDATPSAKAEGRRGAGREPRHGLGQQSALRQESLDGPDAAAQELREPLHLAGSAFDAGRREGRSEPRQRRDAVFDRRAAPQPPELLLDEKLWSAYCSRKAMN